MRTTRSMKTSFVSALAGTAAALLLAVTLPTSASAATGVLVSPSSGPATGFSTTVTAVATTSGHSYRVGLCSKATFSGVPACTYVGSTFIGDGTNLSVTGTVTETFTNAHAGIGLPGQPSTYNCDGDLCEIVLTDNHGGTSFPTFKASITFS